jgi:streptomycin 6-kinase
MTRPALQLPDMVLRNLAHRGEDGARWLAGLPEVLDRLERDWEIEIRRMMPSGTEAYVAEAVGGIAGVIKIPIVGVEKADREFRVLEAAAGRGYARVIRHDPATNAMLLEKLGPQLAQLRLPVARQIEIICATLETAWQTPATGLSLMTGAQKAQAHIDCIEAVRPKRTCSARAADLGLRFARQRRDAFDPATAVLGHGDAHAWNTLSDPRTGGFKFVDPDGLLVERAYDLAIAIREWSAEPGQSDPVEGGRSRCALLARLTGVDPVAIWQWGYVERLVNGLLYADVGSPDIAAQFIDVAEAWALSESS